MSGKIQFIVTALGVLLIVWLAAWFLGPQFVMGSLAVMVLLIVAWPVLFIVFGLIAGVIFGILAQQSGAEDLAEAGVRGSFWYYPKLFTFRNPAFWGGLLGTIVAVALLYGYWQAAIVRKEVAARKQLTAIAADIESYRKEEGRYPATDGQYLHEALGLEKDEPWRKHALVDPWNRPLHYTRVDEDLAESFRLKSSGWNGRIDSFKGDDVSVDGTAIKKGAAAKKLIKAGTKKAWEWLQKKKEDENSRQVPAE
jgi:hypothetical protein